MEEAGTAAVGDIANTFASVAPVSRSRLHAVVFRELIGFNLADPEGRVAAVRAEIAALRSTVAGPVAVAATPAASPRTGTAAATLISSVTISTRLTAVVLGITYAQLGSGVASTISCILRSRSRQTSSPA